MAIVQISKIQHRRGLSENLPQLSSAELGWSIDTQELWIGNGTLAEGAPEVGNTRILTENDLLPSPSGEIVYQQVLVNDSSTVALTDAVFGATTPGVTLNYVITRSTGGADIVRTGIFRFGVSGITVSYDDDYVETADIGVDLEVQVSAGIATVYYTTTNTGYNAIIKYTIRAYTF